MSFSNKLFSKTYFLFLSLFIHSAFSNEPSLLIQNENDKKIFSTSSLLNRKDIEVIAVHNDPAYSKKVMNYKAVKMTNLFQDFKISKDSVILFKALDGFSAPLTKERLLNENTKFSIAYLAIEPENDKWPELKPGKPSAGPFYLIWKNPTLSNISQEEWPFMLKEFEIKSDLFSLYPKIFPDKNVTKENSIYKGFTVFKKNCFVCHTLNKNGTSNMGPDLNLPYNPTEYFKEDYIKKLVRNPQSLREWPNSKMSAFSSESISDAELNDLISYLKHMAKRK